MSRRIFTQTTMNDKEVAIAAIALAGYDYTAHRNQIYIESGPLKYATINLTTGRVEGDVDFGHTESSLGVLRQYYSEALFRRDCLKNGTQIDGKEVTEEGDVVLTWHMG